MVSCEKSPEKRFDHSVIPGQYTLGNAKECHFHGMNEGTYTISKTLHCSLFHCRQIPPDTIFGVNEQCNSEIYSVGEKYTIKIDFNDPSLPTDILIELNEKYEARGIANHELYAYFNVLENDLYESIDCNTWASEEDYYFVYDARGDCWLTYELALKSKTQDSLVWDYWGRRWTP